MDANSHWQMFSEQIPAHVPSDGVSDFLQDELAS